MKNTNTAKLEKQILLFVAEHHCPKAGGVTESKIKKNFKLSQKEFNQIVLRGMQDRLNCWADQTPNLSLSASFKNHFVGLSNNTNSKIHTMETYTLTIEIDVRDALLAQEIIHDRIQLNHALTATSSNTYTFTGEYCECEDWQDECEDAMNDAGLNAYYDISVDEA